MPTSIVSALDELWKRVQERPLYAPPNFFKYIKLRAQTRLQIIDPSSVSTCAPVGKINDCSNCLNNCCVGPRSIVLLRLRDIASLIDVKRTDLITHEKPTFSEDELSDRPALRRQTSSAGWQIFPILKRTAYGACLALTEEGRCSLYPHWPLSCARFPYAFHAEDREVFYSPRCDSFWIRSDGQERAEVMAAHAVVSYNERIKDLILMAYAMDELTALGLTKYLRIDASQRVL